jgi:hypothetical protein
MYKSVDFLAALPKPSSISVPDDAVVFFENIEEFTQFKNEFQATNDELYYTTAWLTFLERNTKSFDKAISTKQIEFLQQRKNVLECDIKTFPDKISFERCSMKAVVTMLNKSLNTQHLSTLRSRFNEYKTEMSSVLALNGADMSRKDLLEHCFQVFAYYEFYAHRECLVHYDAEGAPKVVYQPAEKITTTLVEWKAPGRMGIFSPVFFRYNLDNDSLKDFEDEIRSDLVDNHVSLDNYPPIVKNYEITKPPDVKALALGQKILPIIDNWMNVTNEERTFAWEMLKMHNELNLIQEFSISFNNVQDEKIKTGYVQLGDRKKNFTMKVSDMILRIPSNSRQSVASPQITKHTVQCMQEEYHLKLQNPGSYVRCSHWDLDS